jgi:hypothetical protein
MKQHDTAAPVQPVREWLTEPERRAMSVAQTADIASGAHPERYVGWRYWTAECVEQGMRALCGATVKQPRST